MQTRRTVAIVIRCDRASLARRRRLCLHACPVVFGDDMTSRRVFAITRRQRLCLFTLVRSSSPMTRRLVSSRSHKGSDCVSSRSSGRLRRWHDVSSCLRDHTKAAIVSLHARPVVFTNDTASRRVFAITRRQRLCLFTLVRSSSPMTRRLVVSSRSVTFAADSIVPAAVTSGLLSRRQTQPLWSLNPAERV